MTKTFEIDSGILNNTIDKISLALAYFRHPNLKEYLEYFEYTNENDEYGIIGGEKSYNAGKEIYESLSIVFTNDELSKISEAIDYLDED